MLTDITLRDFFIAHAPTFPQQWFMPTTPPKPAAPPYWSLDAMTTAQAYDWGAFIAGTIEAAGIRSPELREHAEKLAAWRVADKAWSEEIVRQRHIQWPSAWADEQLKLREQRALAQRSAVPPGGRWREYRGGDPANPMDIYDPSQPIL